MNQENPSAQPNSSSHHMGSIGASWALAQTVDGFLKLGRDTALAAFSDNVQPLAIAACEKFGATLAISQFALAKMEATLREQSKAPAHKFLLLKIGYKRGDSLEILSRSAEGIRFLCLASALVSSRQTFDAAGTLSDMIRSTADDKDLSPTVYQLKDLLDILEPRLNRYGFLDEVNGYQTLIAASTGLVMPTMLVPKPEAIKSIVKGFCELSRLGDADAQSIKFTVGRFAPWIAAFARMCVEVPPSILHTNGQQVVEQVNPQVTICISDDPRFQNEAEIELNYTYGTVSKVIECVVGTSQRSNLATGMVTINTHTELLLRELDFHEGLGKRAFDQALPYAVHQVKSFCARKDHLSAYNFVGGEARVFKTTQPFDPFPSEGVIRKIMKAYLRLSNVEPSIEVLPPGLQITDLPLVRLWTNEHHSFLEERPDQEFIRKLSYIVADLFALSLLIPDECTEYSKLDMQLLYIPRRELSEMFLSGEQWQLDVQRILQGWSDAGEDEDEDNESEWIEVQSIINWALKLLGHSASEQVESKKWVASSFRGQVVMPRILLMEEIPQEGFASLLCFPGTLMLEKEKDRQFSWILSQDTNYERTELGISGTLSACMNLFPDQKVQWHLKSKADHLHLSIGWTLNKNAQPPMYVLAALMSSLMMGQCGHKREQAQIRQGSTVLLPPGSNRLSSNITDDVLAAVYPLYQKKELKPLALASTIWMQTSIPPQTPLTIVNRGACINCLLDVCEIAQCKYIIL